MKITFVSTFPPFRCAIGGYTRALASALQAQGHAVRVVSEGGVPDGDIPVVNAYGRTGKFDEDIVRHVFEDEPDVVHIQHAPDLYPNIPRFVRMCTALAARCTVCITWHTVYDNKTWRSVFAALPSSVRHIVHDELAQKVLQGVVAADAVRRIPHGTQSLPEVDPERARRALGWPDDRFVFLFIGFIHAQKNLHTALLAFNRLARRRRDVVLAVTGMPRANLWYNRLYTRACRLLPARKADCRWTIGYVSDAEVAAQLAACDAVLLPYWQHYFSASGVFHLAMAAGKPVICSDSPKFNEVRAHPAGKAVRFVRTHHVAGWAAAMEDMVVHRDGLRDLAHVLRSYGEQTSWPAVARSHAAFYAAAPAV